MTTQLSEHRLLNLGRLPEGQYAYHLTVLNPFKQEFEIEAKMSGPSGEAFVIKDNAEKKNIHVIFNSHADNNVSIRLQLRKGDFIFIKPAVCPQIHEDQQKSAPHSLLARGMVNAFFIHEQEARESLTDSYRPLEVYAKIFKEVQLANEPALNTGLLSSDETFYDFIDLEASRKQLDYVILKKMFTEKKGNFFSRAKRKMARKLVVTVYRILARNPERKDYLAKLYRNYVNMNYLSERNKR